LNFGFLKIYFKVMLLNFVFFYIQGEITNEQSRLEEKPLMQRSAAAKKECG
jgi:hypothetical protein